MTLAPRFGLVVTYVSDIERAKRFYTDVLGLKIEREASTFVQFDHFALASDAPLGESGEPELYWLVENAEAAYAALRERAPIVRPLETKPFGKVFAVRDPDGGVRFVLELARNRPSEAVD